MLCGTGAIQVSALAQTIKIVAWLVRIQISNTKPRILLVPESGCAYEFVSCLRDRSAHSEGIYKDNIPLKAADSDK